jgi:hypothetical protein
MPPEQMTMRGHSKRIFNEPDDGWFVLVSHEFPIFLRIISGFSI